MNKNTIEDMKLSPVELADEISMTNVKYLLVEGQSDRSFWQHLQQEGIEKRDIRIANKKECSGNKEYVKKVINILNKRGKKNAIGIIDMDYDLICNNIENIINLYYYKYIDLENLLIQSTAFSEVNENISSLEKKLSDEKLKKCLYEKTYILGILRLLNYKEKYNFSFTDIDYKKLLDYDQEKFLTYFYSKMNLNKNQINEVSLEIDNLLKEKYDMENICNGHDLLALLSQLTKKIISNDTPIRYTEEIIEQMLILAYRKKDNVADIVECINEIRC